MRNHSSFFIFHSSLIFLLFLFTGCYQQPPSTTDAWALTERQQDSLSFYSTHHYTLNYTFLVTADTLRLCRQQPYDVLSGLPADTISVIRGDRVVVADILVMPLGDDGEALLVQEGKRVGAIGIGGSIERDSVWICVARDQQTIGWLRESELLRAASPNHYISLFIDVFSNFHFLFFLTLLIISGAVYFLHILRISSKALFFHSPYPALLCVLVASSAVLYSSIQLFAPESWRHFYYHPTLNPFILPWHLMVFMLFVWSVVIMILATIDDVSRSLPFRETVFCCLLTAAACGLCYIVFSIATIWRLGYVLLPLFMVYTWKLLRTPMMK